MKKNKETLFSKNGYDTQLEEILENKAFSDEVKSLILNILYKIEMSYKDYSKIKYDIKLKDEIIAEISEAIKSNCDSIKVVNPKDSKDKFKVDKNKKYIEVFPSEIALLQAIYYISSTNKNSSKNMLIKMLLNCISKGNAIDGVEIIRDFNGWSWTNAIEGNTEKHYNLIYQDLVILIGRKNLENALKSSNVKTIIQGKLHELYGERKSSEIMRKIELCCSLLYIYNNEKRTLELKKYKQKQEKKLAMLNNKPEYIAKINHINNEKMKVVTKIERLLNNKEMLEKQYMKPKIVGKYKLLENYKRYLMDIQKKKIEEIDKNSMFINPFEYVKRKNDVENQLDTTNVVQKLSKKNNAVYTNIIDFQRSIISCFHKKIEVYELRKELLNLLNEVRYYNYIPVENELKIKDIKSLEVDIRNVQKKIIVKLLENKMIEKLSNDNNINYSILKYMFISKTINISKLNIKLTYSNRKLHIEYYDENALESKYDINFSDDDAKELQKKLNKKIKIFI